MTPPKGDGKGAVDFLDSEEGWETVKKESGEQITFNTVGDSFTGIYKGMEIIEFEDAKLGPKSFKQYLFTGVQGEQAGKAYAINGGYQLDETLPKVPEGAHVRITLMALVQTDQPSPMKDYRIDVRQS